MKNYTNYEISHLLLQSAISCHTAENSLLSVISRVAGAGKVLREETLTKGQLHEIYLEIAIYHCWVSESVQIHRRHFMELVGKEGRGGGKGAILE